VRRPGRGGMDMLRRSHARHHGRVVPGILRCAGRGRKPTAGQVR
jgi:hypothetical protein